MTPAITPTTESLLRAPLETKGGTAQLGRALWLYLALVLAANHEGLVIRPTARIAHDLSVPETDIETWLERLVQARLVHVLSRSPYLTLRLRFWLARNSPIVERMAASAIDSVHSHREVPVSSSGKQAAAFQANRDGGQGEGMPSEIEIRETLGDEILDVQELLRDVRPAVVQKALDRVRLTPSSRIRTSKTALFRYLLAKFSEEIDVAEL
jgi:hypothetical protein